MSDPPLAGPGPEEVWFGNDHPSLRRCWHPVAAVDQLPGDGPHPVRLLGEHLALFRSAGRWALLPDRCPHRLAPLTAGCVEDGIVRCGYHGWAFDDAGHCVDIPALGPRARTPTAADIDPPAALSERFGLLWAALDPPVTALPELPEWDDPAFGRVAMPVQEWRAGAAQMTDNFLDVGHFPFTHAATIGDADDRMVGDCTVAHDGLSFTARYEHSARVLDGSGRLVRRTMDFSCTAPHHLYLRLSYGVGHGGNARDPGDLAAPADTVVLAFYHQPLDAVTTRLYCIELATSLAADPSGAGQAVAFQMQVAEEDRRLLEQLRTDAIPLHPGAEVHTRADRTTVAYRQLLRDLVATPEPR